MVHFNTIKCHFFLIFVGVLFLCNPLHAVAQDHQVSGVVTSSADGDYLLGATILVKGTTIGTTTNLSGEYSLQVPSETDTLVVSYIGFQSQEVPIESRSQIDISLVPLAVTGEELVVVGYGAQERRDITGSVTSVSKREIQEVPVTDFSQALQGRVAGLLVLNSGNSPGESPTIRIRGRRSLTASNEPLYVVDGIPLEGGINDINPQDIESMEVLKDASATAIYGSRGANGVVLVTTARGDEHRTIVNYSMQSGISQVYGTADMMSADQFVELKRIAFCPQPICIENEAAIFNTAELDGIERGVDMDWPNLIFDDGYQQTHQLSISGGDQTTRYSISGGYFNEQGIIDLQDFERYNFRLNLDQHVTDRFRFGTSTLLTRQVRNIGANPYGTALAVNPLAEPFDEDGNVILYPGADPLLFNPLTDLQPGALVNEVQRLRIFSNIFLEVDILENLNYRMNFGPDFTEHRHGEFYSSLTRARQEDTPLGAKAHDRNFTYTFENIMNYSSDISANQRINLTGLFSNQESQTESTNIRTADLPYESQLFHNLGSSIADGPLGFGSYLEEWGIMSFMGRANYVLMDRYLFTLTGRYDGSSRLSEGNKWGFFPSAAFGWRIINEPFMENQTMFDDLRIRVSYGMTANTGIAPYQTRGSLSRTIYSFNDEAGFGYRPAEISNENLRWETSKMLNLGVDFSVLNDRIAGSFEVYRTKTEDLLLQRQLPITSGFGSILQNIGETENRGFEAQLSAQLVSARNFSWSTNLNIFANREQIVDLYGNREDDIGNEWFIGQPLTVWYDYDMTGIWQLDEAEEASQFGHRPGDIKIRDVNEDGIINEEDRVIMGSDMPKLSGGLNTRLRYRNVDMSVFLFGSFGHTVFNNFEVQTSTLAGRFNNLDVNYWTPDNPSNEHPRPDFRRENPQYGSARGYQKGDFLKVRNVQLGYNFPSHLLSRINIHSLRVYVNADSPLLFSHLDSGLDPERYGGVIQGDVPGTRLYSFGLDINF